MVNIPDYPDAARADVRLPCEVWYATESRVRSPFKMRMRDDHGELECLPGRVRFTGRRSVLDCRDVHAIDLMRQGVPWLSLLLMNASLLVMVYGGVMQTFTPSNPATIPFFAAANAFVFLPHGLARWVRVTFVDELGMPCRAYFVDGSALGWGRIFGGTRRLCHHMRATVLNKERGSEG